MTRNVKLFIELLLKVINKNTNKVICVAFRFFIEDGIDQNSMWHSGVFVQRYSAPHFVKVSLVVFRQWVVGIRAVVNYLGM